MVFYQGVTIGASAEGIYPEFEGRNILYSQSAVIGNLKMGNNAIISNGTRITNQDVPSDTLLFSGKEGLIFKENKKNIIEAIFQI
jgi:serine acetyltransferase